MQKGRETKRINFYDSKRVGKKLKIKLTLKKLAKKETAT